LIPYYKHEKFVVETLNSVVEDDYPNKEIVIIDDGSEDNFVKIISKWQAENEHKINVRFLSRPNKGICKTLNELLDLSKGRYIVIVASDDMLIPGSIGTRVEILNSRPDKLVLVSDAQVINENGNFRMDSSITDYNSGNKNLLKTDHGILLSTLVRPQISGPTVMIDRRVFDIIGRYRENLIAEDWYFYQRAAAKGLILFKDLLSGKYRVHASNNSGSNMEKSAKMARTIALTYWYNLIIMPTFKFRLIALTESLKWSLRYLKYKIL